MKYELERAILRDNPSICVLCRAAGLALRQRAWGEFSSIRDTLRKIYPCSRERLNNLIKASHSMFVSRRGKLVRLENRINGMLSKGRTSFLTLTWNDNALASNKKDTRKKFVRSTLNEVCDDFVANIDFGKRTSREHYHAVCLALDIEAVKSRWRPFGFIKIENVIPSTEGSLALYVDKLCNHALKESAGWDRLMYCRKKKPNPPEV